MVNMRLPYPAVSIIIYIKSSGQNCRYVKKKDIYYRLGISGSRDVTDKLPFSAKKQKFTALFAWNNVY